jgi:hypothetical protein
MAIRAAVFVSNSTGGLNRAHATWLEYAMIQRAQQINQSHLENGTEPQALGGRRATAEVAPSPILTATALKGYSTRSM